MGVEGEAAASAAGLVAAADWDSAAAGAAEAEAKG